MVPPSAYSHVKAGHNVYEGGRTFLWSLFLATDVSMMVIL